MSTRARSLLAEGLELWWWLMLAYWIGEAAGWLVERWQGEEA